MKKLILILSLLSFPVHAEIVSEYFKLNINQPWYDDVIELCRLQHLKALPKNILSINQHRSSPVVWVKVSGSQKGLDKLNDEIASTGILMDRATKRNHKTKVIPDVNSVNWRPIDPKQE